MRERRENNRNRKRGKWITIYLLSVTICQALCWFLGHCNLPLRDEKNQGTKNLSHLPKTSPPVNLEDVIPTQVCVVSKSVSFFYTPLHLKKLNYILQSFGKKEKKRWTGVKFSCHQKVVKCNYFGARQTFLDLNLGCAIEWLRRS